MSAKCIPSSKCIFYKKTASDCWWLIADIRPKVIVFNILLQCTPHTIALDRWRQWTMWIILFSRAGAIAPLCENTVIETPAVPALFLTSFLHVKGKIAINTSIDYEVFVSLTQLQHPPCTIAGSQSLSSPSYASRTDHLTRSR